ncbi:Small auxin-up RNA [Sesbania bispinosa]|nr:Small auxin-up RNA [Sesbania bispinosa]
MLESTGEDNNLNEVPVTNIHKRKKVDIRKGCVPIKVGEGEEQQKIVVPVMYINHPLFSQLLKEAEEEYGFDHQGTIIIPCRVEEFRHIQSLIDREMCPQQHHHHVINCFKPSCQ